MPFLYPSVILESIMNPNKRAVSESAGKSPKKIKLENSEFSETIDLIHSKKSKSEPPSFEKITPAVLLNSKKGKSTSTITPRYRSVMRNIRRQNTTNSPSTSARSSINTVSNLSTSSRTTRTNSVGKSIQDFFAARGASAPVFSSASQQGSTPTVKYIGPPNQLVRSVAQRHVPALSPSAAGSGTSGRNRTSTKTTDNQTGASILMRIEWASIDNPFLCGGHPILLQGKGTIPEMMHNIKTQVTRFENSLKKKLASGR